MKKSSIVSLREEIFEEERKNGFSGKRVICLDDVDSTNNYAATLVRKGCKGNFIVIAESQYAGKGRIDKRWDSQRGKGLYMSVITEPVPLHQTVYTVTLGAAIAVTKVLNGLVGNAARIKWPNDIILDKKKVCGILVESVKSNDGQDYLVIGIGVNINHEQDDFAADIKEKATSIRLFMVGKDCVNPGRNRRAYIAGRIVSELDGILEKSCRTEEFRDIIEEYKKLCATIGRQVKLSNGKEERCGTAVDVAENGALVVRYDDGTVEEVISGEVSVRGIMGYMD